MAFTNQSSPYEQRHFGLDVAVTAAAFGRTDDVEHGIYHLAEALLALRDLERRSYALCSDQFERLGGAICFARAMAKKRLPAKFESRRLFEGLDAALMLAEVLCLLPQERSPYSEHVRSALDAVLIAHHDMVALSMTVDRDRRLENRRRELQNCVVIDFQAKRTPPSGRDLRQ